MRLVVVSTGSAGNSYSLQADRPPAPAVLLDAGVPTARVIRALGGLRGIEGCLITHEHGDHASAAKSLAQYGVRMYATPGTAEAIGGEHGQRIKRVKMLEPVKLGAFTVVAFPTQHDAAEPCGYLIRYEPTGETTLYATDTYYLRNTFPDVNYWIVECNYVEEIAAEMVEAGQIDKALKNRLLESHMSLRRLKDTLRANDLSKTRKIVLVHLSGERSDEARMVREVTEATGIETVAASDGMTIELSLTPF